MLFRYFLVVLLPYVVFANEDGSADGGGSSERAAIPNFAAYDVAHVRRVVCQQEKKTGSALRGKLQKLVTET